MAAYFNQKFNDFWAELALNNEKSWFDENRKRYELDVKKPWESLVGDLLAGVREFDEVDELPASKFVSRINRDIRFSNDKTPYNTHVWAAIAKEGKKTMLPGYYLRLGVDGMWIGGGMHHPDKDALIKIRRSLAKDAAELHSALGSSEFQKLWKDGLSGDKNKILPPEFKEAAKVEPLIAHKGWHYMSHYDAEDMICDDLLEFTLKHFRAGAPINAWFKQALA